MEKTEEKNMPEKKFRAGAISATVWENQGTTKEGTATTFRTISLERCFKDKEDKWQNTKTLRINDLPKAMVVLNKTYEYLVLKGENGQAAA